MKSSETTEPSEAVNPLDLESETFDAKTSLSADEDQVIVPIPGAHTFNNIDEYFTKSFSKSNASKHLPSISASKSEPIFKRTLIVESSVCRHQRRELQTVLTKMKTTIRGPNCLLLKSLNNRIKVLIRRRKSVKLFNERFGWICGVLVAFDKHHNLCMTDVDEKYQRLDQNNETIDVCNHIKQVFLRGDNVVLIAFY